MFTGNRGRMQAEPSPVERALIMFVNLPFALVVPTILAALGALLYMSLSGLEMSR